MPTAGKKPTYSKERTMANDILGVYRGQAQSRTGATAHTPNPTQYHDASAEKLEGESAQGQTVLNKLPGNHGFSKLRGVIIPRATALGGSRGHDHLKAPVIHIDPGPYGDGGIRVDLSKVSPEQMADAVKQSALMCNDLEDAALGAFASIAEQNGTAPGRRYQEQSHEEDERRAPIQMPGTYVVPKALPGGGQQVKRAAFTNRQLQERDAEVRQQQMASPKTYHTQQAPVRSLHAALDGEERPQAYTPPPPPPSSPPTKVTFEIPGGHQFHVLYHDVVRQGMTLVLVYDHNRPFQLVYFPPPMDDEQGEPASMAMLVHAKGSEKSSLYRVQSPGIQFRHVNLEFCVMLVEQEKEMDQEG